MPKGKSLNEILTMLNAVKDEELALQYAQARQQAEYFSPLKMKTTGEQNKLGERNLKVLDKVTELLELIRAPL